LKNQIPIFMWTQMVEPHCKCQGREEEVVTGFMTQCFLWIFLQPVVNLCHLISTAGHAAFWVCFTNYQTSGIKKPY